MKKQNRFSGFFGYEGGFSYYAGKLFDIMAVSLFWLLGSLFIVTAGTSFSALYAAASRSIRQDAEPFSSRFLKSYGQNLKTGIPLWLLFLGVVFLLLLNIGILLKKMNTAFGWFFIVLYGAVILIAIMAAKSAQTRAEEEMVLAVRRARSHGFSWRQIGDVLHITRQAAHSRFAHKVGEAAA